MVLVLTQPLRAKICNVDRRNEISYWTEVIGTTSQCLGHVSLPRGKVHYLSTLQPIFVCSCVPTPALAVAGHSLCVCVCVSNRCMQYLP